MHTFDLTSISLLNFGIALAIYLWIFWGFYVLVMGIYRAYLRKKLNYITLPLSAPFVLVGGALDIFANIFIATFLFLELPQELLVTTRLARHNKLDSSGWRTDIASYICTNLLDVFDPTEEHC